MADSESRVSLSAGRVSSGARANIEKKKVAKPTVKPSWVRS